MSAILAGDAPGAAADAPPASSSSSSTPAPSDGTTTTVITATTHLTLPAHPTPMTYAELNPRSAPTEFLGPIGTGAITFLAPLFTYIFFFTCNDAVGCTPTTISGWKRAWDLVGNFPSEAGQLWEWKAAAVYLGWYAFTILAWAVLPGDRIEGNLLRDGTRKTYRMNGFYTLLLTLGISLGVILQPGGIHAFTWLYDHFVPLVSASLVMATAQAAWVYGWSYYNKELLSLGANSGNFVYDFFMGRPLNPHPPFFPSFDIKTFNEVRPGMILWLVLNISCACEQYLRLGRVTDSMWLVLIFEGWYTADCLIQENYFGDWLIALGWCLPTLFHTPLTYYYLVYFIILLLHRQMRDDEACRKKYGKDWDKYCELVPYKIIPYVY